MSDERVAFAGDQERGRPILAVSSLPMRGAVTVTPIARAGDVAGGGRSWTFEVRVEWFGAPAPGSGFPVVPGGVASVDTTHERDRDRALRLAQLAVDELRAGRVPVVAALAPRAR